jgi:hypothetical protein
MNKMLVAVLLTACAVNMACVFGHLSAAWLDSDRSPDGAQRNPGAALPVMRDISVFTDGLIPDYASLHPGYNGAWFSIDEILLPAGRFSLP